jgi:S1-C subfamily serine protease
MSKKLLFILGIFIIGMVGGIFSNQIFWPYFVEKPLFYQYGLDKGPIYLTETKEIYIQENTALVQAIEKVEKTIVQTQAKTKAGKTIKGAGFVVTSDGLIITLAEFVPQGADFDFFVDNQSFSYQILKRDLKDNLALIKLADSSLNTVGFASLDKLKMGERVFLLGPETVNQGIVSSFNQNMIQTNMIESVSSAGSPVFNIQGEILGISVINSQGKVSIIPITKIRSFIGI